MPSTSRFVLIIAATSRILKPCGFSSRGSTAVAAAAPDFVDDRQQ